MMSDKSIKERSEEANLLAPYYIETRYPADPPPEYSREKARIAIETAERVRQFVWTKFGLGNSAPELQV